MLPVLAVVVGFLEAAEVPESPCNLVSVAFHIAVVGGRSPDDSCYILGYARFLGNANYHFGKIFLMCKDTKNISAGGRKSDYLLAERS